jgi:hypothetical protein
VVFSVGDIETRVRYDPEALAGEMINTKIRFLHPCSAGKVGAAN